MENREPVDPTTLISDIAKPRMTNSVLISFGLHILMLGLLSISFIGECIEYKTTHPAVVKKQLEKERIEAEKRKKQEEAAKVAQLKAQQQEQDAQAKKENSKTAPAQQQTKAAPAAEKKTPADPLAGQMEDPANATMSGAIEF